MKKAAVFIFIALFSHLFSDEPEKEYVLITSLYGEANPERRAEFMECMLKNLDNPRITQIHVLFDTSRNEDTLLNFLNQLPIKIDFCTGRPTFATIFDIINQQYDQKNIIIANADIYFDDSLNRLDAIDLQNIFIVLARWNVALNRITVYPTRNPHWTHDVWIFKSPVKPIDNTGIQLGTQHCDGYIAFKAFAAGYQVFNPCHSVKCYHLHISGIRHWKRRRPSMNCLSVPACSLENIRYSAHAHIRRYR